MTSDVYRTTVTDAGLRAHRPEDDAIPVPVAMLALALVGGVRGLIIGVVMADTWDDGAPSGRRCRLDLAALAREQKIKPAKLVEATRWLIAEGILAEHVDGALSFNTQIDTWIRVKKQPSTAAYSRAGLDAPDEARAAAIVAANS